MMENLVPRHQLSALKRSVRRPQIEDSDRMLWILLRRTFKEWRDAFVFVKPDTVVRRHGRGFAYYGSASRAPSLAGRASAPTT